MVGKDDADVVKLLEEKKAKSKLTLSPRAENPAETRSPTEASVLPLATSLLASFEEAEVYSWTCIRWKRVRK